MNNDRFSSYWDDDTEMTYPLILAKIPVKNPWEIFAYLPFGNWNDCPDTPDLMAAAKYWFEQYGAVPAAMSHDELEFLLPAPVPKEKAMDVAVELYGFCPDLDQNDGWKHLAPWQMSCGSPPSGISGGIDGRLRPMNRISEGTYIELKKQFRCDKWRSRQCPRSLYLQGRNWSRVRIRQAKEVLVDVYDLLDFKKDAYELLCQIGNRSDKKTLKRLGTLKDYAENWGNHYALPKPKTPEEKQKEKERQAQLGLPAFRYHPNPLETGAFEESADGVVCDCCGKTTHIFYTGPFYAVEDIAVSVPGVYLQRRGGPEI